MVIVLNPSSLTTTQGSSLDPQFFWWVDPLRQTLQKSRTIEEKPQTDNLSRKGTHGPIDTLFKDTTQSQVLLFSSSSSQSSEPPS